MEIQKNNKEEKHIEINLKPLLKHLIIIIIGIIIGFYYKIPTGHVYKLSRLEKHKWKSELLIKEYKANENFFGLRNFNFNWEAFIISTILIILILYIRKKINTKILYEKMKTIFGSV